MRLTLSSLSGVIDVKESLALAPCSSLGLACPLYVEFSEQAIVIQPLPHTYVVKDLVTDLTSCYNQYESIEP